MSAQYVLVFFDIYHAIHAHERPNSIHIYTIVFSTIYQQELESTCTGFEYYGITDNLPCRSDLGTFVYYSTGVSHHV